MRPEDEALLARVSAPRRDAVKAALDYLQQIRENYGEARDDELPPEVRERGFAALRLVRRETQESFPWAVVLLGAFFFSVGALFAYFVPADVYTCSPTRGELVRCVVRERALGLVPRSFEVLPPIASAEGHSSVETEQYRESSGRTRSQRVRVRTIAFRNERGTVLYERTVKFGLGMDPEELARSIERLVQRETRTPVVRWVSVWPVLLVATLFCFFGFEMVWQNLAARALLSDLAAVRGLFSRPVTVTVRLALVSVLIASWGIALVGGAPPGWLVSLLHLAP